MRSATLLAFVDWRPSAVKRVIPSTAWGLPLGRASRRLRAQAGAAPALDTLRAPLCCRAGRGRPSAAAFGPSASLWWAVTRKTRGRSPWCLLAARMRLDAPFDAWMAISHDKD